MVTRAGTRQNRSAPAVCTKEPGDFAASGGSAQAYVLVRSHLGNGTPEQLFSAACAPYSPSSRRITVVVSRIAGGDLNSLGARRGWDLRISVCPLPCHFQRRASSRPELRC